jgi:1,2-diacylglycerol 3-beta-glucosyltransferase
LFPIFVDILAISVALSIIMGVLFLIYLVTIIIPYLFARRPDPGVGTDFQWHLFVPCRDEEAVIGSTLAYLRANYADAHVWVIDDDSDDETATIVRHQLVGDQFVHLVSRTLPNARTGKGDALNAAYHELNRWMGQHTDRSDVIVGVIDADGRPSPNILDVAAAPTAFGRADVAAVQVEVRMVNRTQHSPLPAKGRLANFLGRQLIRMQDLEFRGPIAAMQLARKGSRTVNIGGNGQFTRLSALDIVNDEFGVPWHGSLLEDYELGLHLLLSGWQNVHTTAAWVDQEALPDLRRLLTQRTRWAQGTMQCGRYFLQVWRSRRIGNVGAIEISYFMLQPWLQLAGTFFYTVPIVALIVNACADPRRTGHFLHSGGWVLLALYGVVGIGEFAAWGPLYKLRSERDAPWSKALGWGLAFVAYILLFYIVTWRAFARIITGRSGWAKTRRNAEDLSIGPVARQL